MKIPADAAMLPDARASTFVTLSLVVPVFNEAEAVAIFLERIRNVFDGNASLRLEVVFINDGSTDGTLERLLALQTQDARVRIIDLSRHFGKEAALAAGLQTSTGQVVVPIDVDLQDPPELVLEMLEKWREGFDAVLGRRIHRGTDTLAKRLSATWFYRIHNWLSDLQLPENVGDFRLLDRVVVNALNSLPESHRFMKGLFAWAGFNTAYVDYARPERVAGSSKFNGWRLWNFALEGITSFSTVPLRIWTYVGFAVALLSFFYGLRIAVNVFLHGIDVAGYASIFVAVTFLGGLQLMGIGVIGEYLGRTYHESKRRPVYLVRRLFEPADAPSPPAT
jgi:glycosyltransferase involved in cell wall biosynthesis